MTIGWDTAEDDASVDVKDIRAIKFRPDEERLKAGSKVDVMWKRKYYSATIQQVKGAKYLIHYTGYDDSWDEWVSAARIR